MAQRTTFLHDGWTLTATAPGDGSDARVLDALPVPATVPGAAHTDLLAAGLIPDPYLDSNEAELEWIGHTGWCYTTRFEVSGPIDERVDLVFDGLDTLSSITLNGRQIAQTRNMHRRYRFPVAGHLRVGTNVLSVEFASPWGPSEQAAADGLPDVYSPFTHLRKMACNFGWDWGPALVTSGIWRPVRLERWSTARLAAVRPTVSVSDGRGSVIVEVDIERTSDAAALRVEATVAGITAAATVRGGETSALIEVQVDDPQLWWPAELGPQPLYDLAVGLSDEHEPLDSWKRRIGFRTLTVDTTPDDAGIPFVFRVNGVDVPIRGANWIPDDCFPSRVDRARIDRRLAQARGANINLLRVWGGGIYESDDFYTACDELGILVWQDFLFACAPYREDEPLLSEVELEARDNVERLMSHASLALWNGNNETFLGWTDWDWKERLDGRPWGDTYYLSVLPKVVAQVDPTRSYWAGSPYSGSPEVYYNDPSRGLVHLWDAWNEKDYSVYRDYPARFVAEFGWQGPPAWSTLVGAVHDDPLRPDSPGVLHHQKAYDGNGKLSRGLAPHFVEPADMADWHFAMQINQARAITYAIEHFRSLRPLNMGTVVWQLNDCWPVTSWAVVDGEERLKPAWYALRDAYAPRLLTIQPRATGLELFAVDDSGLGWSESVAIRRMDVDGTILARQDARVATKGHDADALALSTDVCTPGAPRREFVVAESESGRRALWFFVEDKDFDYPRPNLVTAVEPAPGGARVRLKADVLVRDLSVLADQIAPQAQADTMLITLLPGDEREIIVRGVDAARLVPALRYPILRSANDLVLGTR
ncbi:glycoside hydrolase family 2 protein [Actinoallomurus purpureus]|uniref:glycoside hydrolase family 2 protein n=1 Tax=Actinoallomurus purpureus TaxID=478114 RepID=UPI002092D47E|nr:glycoside hydrolase family 2 protein [Actinoallomurus purpureus]MCO6006991.1 glycoside hydrolase family 2 protein [Actinoallomurus purpureus]